MTAQPRRSREFWTDVALRALADGGLASVAVEPLAAQAGATKGSIYWHFPNREALVEATLARWEREHTELVLGQVDAGAAEPAERLHALLATALTADAARVELSLLACADDPQVSSVMTRVTEFRLRYLARLFGQLGLSRAWARRRALLAYSVYLGQAQLARADSATLPRAAAARRAYLDDAVRLLVAPPDGS